MSLENPMPLQESEPEKIGQAALVFKGKTFVGNTHWYALVELMKEFHDWEDSDEEPQEGFLTSTGRFVTREEATEIAKASGQIDKDADGQINSYDL